MQIQFDGITTEDLDECVICLEGVESEILDGEYPLEISEIPKLVTTCQCKGHVHRHCIKKWTRQRPVCPFCNEAAMYFDSSPTNSDSSDEEDRILVRQKCCSDPMLPSNLRYSGRTHDYYRHYITYMIRFMAGMAVGIWIGTSYDCKPYIDMVTKYIMENAPKKR